MFENEKFKFYFFKFNYLAFIKKILKVQDKKINTWSKF